jgi:hypothetical protein
MVFYGAWWVYEVDFLGFCNKSQGRSRKDIRTVGERMVQYS